MPLGFTAISPSPSQAILEAIGNKYLAQNDKTIRAAIMQEGDPSGQPNERNHRMPEICGFLMGTGDV